MLRPAAGVGVGFKIGSELIVELPFFGIAQDVIGLLDFLKLFLGLLFVLCQVGMMFSSQAAIGLLNLALRCVARDSQNLVVIL